MYKKLMDDGSYRRRLFNENNQICCPHCDSVPLENCDHLTIQIATDNVKGMQCPECKTYFKHYTNYMPYDIVLSESDEKGKGDIFQLLPVRRWQSDGCELT